MNAVAERILLILVERFKQKGADNFDHNKELEMVDPVSERVLAEEEKNFVRNELLKAINFKESYDGAVLIPVSVVSDPRDHEEWYEEWLADHNDHEGSYYWKRLEDFLSFELTRKYGAESAGEVVRSIDEATFSIMKKIANPNRAEFNYKGLVVGYVQSGKTANFTALIAKAADAGYKFIVVLSGIHSILRRQTQIRLDKELTGMNDLNLNQFFIDEPSDIKRWNRITTGRLRTRRSRNGQLLIKDLGEFDTVNVDPFNSLCNRSTPTIAIIKKNVKVLNRLIDYISQSDAQNRSNMPLLVIDDEADQASVDGNANDPDSDPTSTNECIRSLLSFFSRKAYIGYTATPFANALIDMSTEHDDLEDDLYPRNFIISLPKPNGYFGASMIFQGDLSENFVCQIPAEGNQLFRSGQITENLSRAIDQFLLGCSIRNLRGDRLKPMSMLIHVSHRIPVMTSIKHIVDEYIEDLLGRFHSVAHAPFLKENFREEWEEYVKDSIAINQQLNLENEIPDYEELWGELENVFSVLQVMELNSGSDDRLDYSSGEEMKVIAVGGNQLSRGLTLEGLMISYYLRDSRQYDTLLQMGRWFGYRQGYEDLTRIHTTELIWEFFEHLALVEQELRSEIYRYEEEEKTPLEMAIAIRDHRRLNVTAPNKMGAARQRQVSYSGSLNQTIWFPLDKPEILRANFNLGESFVRYISENVGFTNVMGSGVYLSNEKINGEIVLDEFLNRYNFVERESTGGPGLDADNLLSYIFRRLNDSELNEWSVALIGNASPTTENTPINYGGIDINRIQRSRKHTEKGYNIGVLTDPAHLTIDLVNGETRSSQNPLLLLYPIWKDSRARIQRETPLFNQRIDLYRFVDTEKVDVLGVAIVLPESRNEPNSYIGQ